jgi:excisionase family DNA binding protein
LIEDWQMSNTAKFNGSAMQMISINQLGDILGVSRATIYRWIKDGLIPAPIQLGPRRVAFPRESVEKLISSRVDVSKAGSNAHLIAAAPDLLAALQDIYAIIEREKTSLPLCFAYSHGKAANAIARAKGESV